jgi:hypothetical protein
MRHTLDEEAVRPLLQAARRVGVAETVMNETRVRVERVENFIAAGSGIKSVGELPEGRDAVLRSARPFYRAADRESLCVS